MSKEKPLKDSFLQEAVTLPGIILALIGATKGQSISKRDLDTKLRQFATRDVDEAITFLQYKGLVTSNEFKANGDYTLYPTF
jgi:hypothetical protein